MTLSVATAVAELGDVLLSHGARGIKEVSAAEVLKDVDVVALYFSASWCTPCQGFTEQLIKAYAKANDCEPSAADKDAGKRFQVVFVPWCNEEAAFDKYFGVMPWLAVPWMDEKRRKALNTRFKVTSVPTLRVLGRDGSILCNTGVDAVRHDPDAEGFPWAFPHAHELCHVDDGSRLLTERALVAFIESETEDVAWGTKRAMEAVAREYAARTMGKSARITSAGTDRRDSDAAESKGGESERVLCVSPKSGSDMLALPESVTPSLILHSSHSCTDSLQVRLALGMPPAAHPHDLEEVPEDEMEARQYSPDPLVCSGCRSAPDVVLLRCKPCNFLLCEECLEVQSAARSVHAGVAATKSALVLLDIPNGGCFLRTYAPGAIGRDAVVAFLSDVATGKLSRIALPGLEP